MVTPHITHVDALATTVTALPIATEVVTAHRAVTGIQAVVTGVHQVVVMGVHLGVMNRSRVVTGVMVTKGLITGDVAMDREPLHMEAIRGLLIVVGTGSRTGRVIIDKGW